MSKSAARQFDSQAREVIESSGGSHLTRDAKLRTLDKLEYFLHGREPEEPEKDQDREPDQEPEKDQGQASDQSPEPKMIPVSPYGNLKSPDQLSARHVKEYIAWRQKSGGPATRTLHNEVSHIRGLMRPERANAPQMSSKQLGLESSCRAGTKTAVTADQLQGWIDHARGVGRSGIACALEVSRELGLRSQEIIRASEEQLRTWAREAQDKSRVTVVHGTKGGRVRDTTVVDPARTVAVLQRAADVATAQGGYLIARADGKPVADLKSATTIYRSYASRNGIQTHSTRYAYAREIYEHYRSQGHSHGEACSRTSVDLGHGDGRGAYVELVYLR